MILEAYNTLLIVMSITAIIVFIALYFVEAGYGYLYNPKFGAPLPSKVGWILMESPIFFAMLILWLLSDRRWDVVPLILLIMFQIHYFWRSFIFPLKMKGSSKMPLGIVLMGAFFNTINSLMQGGWIFYVAPDGYYNEWLSKPYIYVGALIFFAGMYINRESDSIIRNLRSEGDHNHYIPYGGMFKYVCCANYFGELLEWVGFAIASWSLGGVVFVVWTFANLAPRSASLYKRYESEFGDQFTSLKRKKIIPFIW